MGYESLGKTEAQTGVLRKGLRKVWGPTLTSPPVLESHYPFLEGSSRTSGDLSLLKIPVLDEIS
jgi:hypothetical protein